MQSIPALAGRAATAAFGATSLILGQPAAAQSIHLPMARCSSLAGPASPKQMGFGSHEHAAAIVRQIAAHAGLAANFAVRPGETDGGAVASTCYDTTVRQIRRLVIYQPAFMEEIRQRSGSYWSLVGVLAHEIGHHANGHTLYRSWGHEKELEADRFAGFVLGRMGATHEQALSGIRVYGEAIATATHPARADRVAAVSGGWQDAQSTAGGIVSPRSPRERANPRIIKAPPGTAPIP